VTLAAMVADLQTRGVTLEPRGDQLAIRPPTLVTPAELEILRQHKTEILALLTGPPTPLPGVRSWVYPWPANLPGLGPARVDHFEICAGCSVGTWTRYGAVPLCFSCASARTRGAA
jgi:hypothetical protein